MTRDGHLRFLSLNVSQFGALHERRFATDRDTVVICGRNERGKSSFHQALRAALFGLHGSASARDQEACELAATLDESGRVLQVQRRFDGGAASRIALEGEAIEAQPWVRGGDALPAIKGVSQGLFDAVFTLHPDALQAVDSAVSPEVEALLSGGSGLPGLPSAASLIADIETERRRIRRDDRRSKKTLVAEIDSRLSELRAESREVRKVEASLLDMEAELSEGRESLVRAATERDRLQLRLGILDLTSRVAKITREAQRHDADLDPIAHVALSPPGPLLAALEDAELALEAPAKRLEQPALDLTDEEEAILAASEAITGTSREREEASEALRSAEEMSLRADEKRAAAANIERSIRPGAAEPLDPHALGQLKAEVALGAGAIDDQGRGRRTDRSTDRGRAWLAAAGFGAVAGGATWLGDAAPWAVAIASLGPFAAAGAALQGEPTATSSRPSSVSPRTLNAAGLSPQLAALPTELSRALESLESSQELRREAGVLDQRAAAARSRREALHGRWLRMLNEFIPAEADHGWTQPDSIPALLQGALKRAEKRAQDVSQDARERRDAEAQRSEAQTRLQEARERFEHVQAALEAAVPDESILENAFARVTAARAAQERARGALRELRGESSWAHAAADPRMALALREGTYDGGEERALNARIADLEDAETDRREELARLDERLTRVRPLRTRSEIDSELDALQTKRSDALDEAAALDALADAVRAGEASFRESHRPEVLARASAILESITERRYRELCFERDQGLKVFSAEFERFVPCAPPLSRGAREQIHLSLRLGVADTADAGGPRLPLLLDEALVHWDEVRRRAFFSVLRSRLALGSSRQVFLFTCHEALADEATEALDALRIDL